MYGNVQDDIRRYEKRIEETRRSGNRLAEGDNLSNLAAVYSTEVSVLDFHRAARYGEQARQIFREEKDWHGYARESDNLATIYEYEEGLNDPRRALQVCEDTLRQGGIYIPEKYREKLTGRVAWLKEKLNRKRGY